MIDLSGLPSTLPDVVVTDRIRRRCHSALVGEPRKVKRRGDGWLFAAAAAYLAAAVHQALGFLN